MLIEKITLIGFGGITNESVDFSADQLNLLIEPNEFGKSTIAECVWATLFDFSEHSSNKRLSHERENMKPWNESAKYEAVLDLLVGDRRLRIQRNFADKTVKVIDRATNSDITSEFLGPDEEDLVGLKLTGMNSDLFRNTCLVGQRHLDEHHVATADVSTVLQGIADTASPTTTAGSAIGALENAINVYNHDKRNMHLDKAIEELEEKRANLLQKLAAMDDERKEVAAQLRNLAGLDGQLSGEADPALISRFDSLRLDLMDVEKRLFHISNRYDHRVDLESQLRDIEMNAPAQQAFLAKLNDLWTRRESRQEDVSSLGEQIQPQQEEYERLELEINERYTGVQDFSLEEANTISGLAVNIYKLQQEINNLQKDLQEQTGRHLLKIQQSTAQHGIALDALKKLEKEEIEEAKNYESLLQMFYAQVAEEDKRIQETKFGIDDLEERRKARRAHNLGLAIGLFVTSLVMFGAAALIRFMEIESIPQLVILFCILLGLLAIFCAFIFGGMFLNYKYYLRAEAEEAREEAGKHKKALKAANSKIATLEAKLSQLAVKTGAQNKADLLRYINEVSNHESVVQEQTSHEKVVETEEQKMKKIQMDLAYYFERAGRDTEVIDSQRAMDLSQDITQCRREKASLEDQFEEIRNARKQLDFLMQEIEDTDREILAMLNQIGLDTTGGIESMRDEMSSLLETQSKKQALADEIARADYDLAGYADIRAAIEQLEGERDSIQEQLNEILAAYPDMANLPDPDPKNPPAAVLPWGGGEASDQEEVRAKKDEILVKIRTTCNNRDELYLDALETLDSIDHELVCTRRAKQALMLARDVIKQLSSETYVDWAVQLNKESQSVIEGLDLDIERIEFDPNLNITVKLKGHDRTFTSKEVLAKLSTGTREQIHWLARIIVSRYLSQKESLPIILDEPFSEADDSRFVGMMKFLIASILPNHQVIVLSCHHQRHQWLSTQLGDEQQTKLAFRKREPVKGEVLGSAT